VSRINRIGIAKAVGYSIATIAAVSSYGHQVELLQHAGLDPLFGVVPSEWITPTTVDSLAIIALIVRTSHTATPAMKRAALFPLILAGGLSVAANVATAHNLIQVIVGVWTVLAYILAELFVSKLDNRTARTTAMPAAAGTVTPVAPVSVPSGPVTPVVPAPAAVAAPIAAPAVPARVDVAPPVPAVVERPIPAASPSTVVAAPVVSSPVSSGESTMSVRAVKPPAPATAPSRANTRVHAPAAAVTPVPPVPVALLARAKEIAKAHLATNGVPITAGELAVRLRVASVMSAQIVASLDLLPDSPTKPAAALNGSAVTTTR
jgi:hypothetical protein